MAKKQAPNGNGGTPEPDDTIPGPPPKGRVRSLPSALQTRTQVGKQELREQAQTNKNGEQQGRPHRSRSDDTSVSLEEYEAVREILHPGRNQGELDARTEVNTLQLIHFSRGRVIAKRFGIKYLDEYITSIERLSLSLKRKSRLEHVKALAGIMQNDQQANGILSKLQ